MAQSLATFEPTRSMRLLGLFGVIGAVLLLWAFISFNPFVDPRVNSIRLLAFSLAGAAISLAFYRRQALVAPTLALLTTGAVVIAGLWSSTVLILSSGVERPFIGTFGLIGLFANIALFVTPAIWALGLLAWLAGRSPDLPSWVSPLGIVLGLVLVITWLARLIVLDATSMLVLGPALVSGLLSPVFFLLLGAWLLGWRRQ